MNNILLCYCSVCIKQLITSLDRFKNYCDVPFTWVFEAFIGM